MKHRLKELMNKEGLSAKQFAERIGVQASSVSHILTGRNKPSIDFIEKLLKSFPNMDLRYLIIGDHDTVISKSASSLPIEEQVLVEDDGAEMEEKKQVEYTNVNSDVKVMEIVTFYSDGTFSLYRPKK